MSRCAWAPSGLACLSLSTDLMRSGLRIWLGLRWSSVVGPSSSWPYTFPATDLDHTNRMLPLITMLCRCCAPLWVPLWVMCSAQAWLLPWCYAAKLPCKQATESNSECLRSGFYSITSLDLYLLQSMWHVPETRALVGST